MSSTMLVVLGYVLGSIPFALILVQRVGGIDLRHRGSGNVGATNAFRTMGPVVGTGALALDVTKGAVAVLLAQRLGGGEGSAVPAAAGLAAIAGHVYPVWLSFRGGKGVATACGVFAVLAPLATACAALVFVLTIWRTRYVSLGSLTGSVALGPAAYVSGAPVAVVVGAAVAALMILERHRANLGRLWAGAERRIERGGR
jgi:glycerol-3-phosphate acyltransferase PlsY